MYLLGTESVGKLIKELALSKELNIKYENEFNDYAEEKIILTMGNIKYTITLEEGKVWTDKLLFIGDITQEEINKLLDNNITYNKEKNYISRKVRILTYTNEEKITSCKYLINAEVYKKSIEWFDEDELIFNFNYITDKDSYYAEKIVEFVKENNLNFAYSDDVNGKNKRDYIIEVDSLDEFNNYED